MDSPHSKQLKLGRFSQVSRLYLLTSTTLHRSQTFREFDCARLLVAQFRQAQDEGAIRSLAWVVMPDHFHWLVELGPVSLKHLMRRVKSRSTMNHKTYAVPVGAGLPAIGPQSGPRYSSNHSR